MSDDMLQQGIAAVKAGNVQQARQLLNRAISQNPNDERAWGWLYNVCENDQERIRCLREVLRINPNREIVKKKLDELSSLEPPLPSPKPPPVTATRISQPIQKVENRSNYIWIWIVVLVILAIILCIFGVIIFRTYLPFAMQPTNTSEPATPLPTLTRLPTLTNLPTLTPITTQTTLPTVSNCPDGWKRLEGRSVDICLPASWEGGSDEGLDTLIAKFKTLGAVFQYVTSEIESNRSSYILLAFDLEGAYAGTSMNIMNTPVAMPINQYMYTLCAAFPVYFQQYAGTANCLETTVVAIGNIEEVGKVVVEESVSGQEMREVQYIIEQGIYYWAVSFKMDPSFYPEILTIFETAISTLNIDQP